MAESEQDSIVRMMRDEGYALIQLVDNWDEDKPRPFFLVKDGSKGGRKERVPKSIVNAIFETHCKNIHDSVATGSRWRTWRWTKEQVPA